MITEFAQGSTILVDKPFKWTSFDAVNKLRWHLRQKLGVKKLKVGHAGTLDPLATGLLVICIGKHTKLIEGLTSDAKTYTGTFLLGKTTPSYDLETEYNSEKETSGITPEKLEEVRMSFWEFNNRSRRCFQQSKLTESVPMTMRVQGSKELKANTVEIMDFKIEASRFPEVDFEISCSKGTYIRSIAHDFGQKLGCGATLIALRRTKSGIYDIADSKSVEEWISFIEDQPL